MEQRKHPSPVSDTAPLVGGRYALECALGEGGMGTVWRALDLRTQRHVAIKLLHCRGPEASRRLRREMQALARLRHPNLVDVLDSGTTDEDAPYMVMELVLGTTLKDELRRANRMPVDRVCPIAGQIARALVAAHAEGVVHRDVKPSNVMLSELYGEHDIVKLVDFGVAQVVDSGQASLGSARFVGTPDYASPEQAKGEATTPHTDLYALGVVMYEMLTGRLPFQAETSMGMLFHHANTLPQPPGRLARGVPEWLDGLVTSLLQKAPNRRPQSAREVLNCLQDARRATLETALETAHTTDSLPRAALEATRLDHFVGRELEQARLRGAVDRAVVGAGGVVFISGDAGIGKTMLLARLPSLARAAGHTVFVASGRCLDHSAASEPYLPFLQAVGEWLTGVDAERARKLLRRHAPTWCLQFPSAFGSDGTLDQLRREAHGATRERMLRELADVLDAAAEERCLLLLLEDLHWADPSSVDQIRLLCQRSERRGWLVVGTFRAEGLATHNPPLDKLRHDLRRMSHCDEVTLAGLTGEQVAAYLEARFPAHDFPSSFFTTLTTRTEGHPLFVTRLLDLLVERGDLVEEEAIWRLARPAEKLALEVPVSISSVIQRKLDALAGSERKVLQYASVEGPEFASDVLAELLGEPELELEERLVSLERSHRLIVTLDEEELSPGRFVTRYRFAHMLYRDHLYAELTSGRRRDLHRRVAGALLRRLEPSTPANERVRSERGAIPSAVLALHFERGQELVHASDYLLQAGESAERVYASDEAGQLYAHGAELLAALLPTERPQHYVRLYENLGRIKLELQQFDQAEGAFESLLAHGNAVADGLLQVDALQGLSVATLGLGKLDKMGVHLEQGLKLARATGDQSRQSALLALRATRELELGKLEGTQGQEADVSVSSPWSGAKLAAGAAVGLIGVAIVGAALLGFERPRTTPVGAGSGAEQEPIERPPAPPLPREPTLEIAVPPPAPLPSDMPQPNAFVRPVPAPDGHAPVPVQPAPTPGMQPSSRPSPAPQLRSQRTPPNRLPQLLDDRPNETARPPPTSERKSDKHLGL
jgi:tetratricopeptide (TPR) repeat protein